MAVKPIPDGFHTITPYLVVRDAARIIEFLKQAFGATEQHRSLRPDGTIQHAQLRIGDSPLMIADGTEQRQPLPCAIYLYVTDTDAAYRQAVAAGATSVMEPADQFYGDRNAGVQDAAAITGGLAPTSRTSRKRSCTGGAKPSGKNRPGRSAACSAAARTGLRRGGIVRRGSSEPAKKQLAPKNGTQRSSCRANYRATAAISFSMGAPIRLPHSVHEPS